MVPAEGGGSFRRKSQETRSFDGRWVGMGREKGRALVRSAGIGTGRDTIQG